MRIKWGAMVTEGRGKLGGHVASKARSGATFFTKPRPNLTTSQYSSRQRAYFAQLSRGWSSLTAAQIQAWNDAVQLFRYTDIFGDSRVLSGKALYQKLNLNLLLSAQPTLADPPVPSLVPSNPLASVMLNTVTGGISYQGSVTGSSKVALLYATPPLSLGTSYYSDRLVLLGTAITNPAGNWNPGIIYGPRLGLPSTNSIVYAAARTVNAFGQVSPLSSIKATLV